MAARKTWLYGHIAGIGPCLFKAFESEMAEDVAAVFKVTALQLLPGGDLQLGRWMPVGNLFRGPLMVRTSAITFFAPALTGLAEKAEAVWADVKVATTEHLRRLDNGR